MISGQVPVTVQKGGDHEAAARLQPISIRDGLVHVSIATPADAAGLPADRAGPAALDAPQNLTVPGAAVIGSGGFSRRGALKKSAGEAAHPESLFLVLVADRLGNSKLE